VLAFISLFFAVAALSMVILYDVSHTVLHLSSSYIWLHSKSLLLLSILVHEHAHFFHSGIPTGGFMRHRIEPALLWCITGMRVSASADDAPGQAAGQGSIQPLARRTMETNLRDQTAATGMLRSNLRDQTSCNLGAEFHCSECAVDVPRSACSARMPEQSASGR
jgi:hypothetical protein